MKIWQLQYLADLIKVDEIDLLAEISQYGFEH